MRSPWAAAAVLGAATAAAAEPVSAPSLCEQVAARVRQSPATVWESNGSPWLELSEHAGDSPVATAGRAALRQAMAGVFPGAATPALEVERLPGTSLLMGSTVAGTAECQTSMFVEVGPDLNATRLPEPPGYTGTCWSLHGDLGRVLDQPAYVEHGTIRDTTADPLLRITPWQSGHWGEACRLTIHLAVHYSLTAQFCGADAALCRTAADAAAEVAHQYDQFLKESGADRGLDGGALTPAFHPGEPQDDAGLKAVERALRVIGGRGTDVADFPFFGARQSNPYEYTFSYVRFAFFPWTLEGRTYLGAAGHAGIGWRGSTRVLVAVYAPPEPGTTVLVPLVGFTIDPQPSGVDSLEVTTGKAAVARE